MSPAARGTLDPRPPTPGPATAGAHPLRRRTPHPYRLRTSRPARRSTAAPSRPPRSAVPPDAPLLPSRAPRTATTFRTRSPTPPGPPRRLHRPHRRPTAAQRAWLTTRCRRGSESYCRPSQAEAHSPRPQLRPRSSPPGRSRAPQRSRNRPSWPRPHRTAHWPHPTPTPRPCSARTAADCPAPRPWLGPHSPRRGGRIWPGRHRRWLQRPRWARRRPWIPPSVLREPSQSQDSRLTRVKWAP